MAIRIETSISHSFWVGIRAMERSHQDLGTKRHLKRMADVIWWFQDGSRDQILLEMARTDSTPSRAASNMSSILIDILKRLAIEVSSYWVMKWRQRKNAGCSTSIEQPWWEVFGR